MPKELKNSKPSEAYRIVNEVSKCAGCEVKDMIMNIVNAKS